MVTVAQLVRALVCGAGSRGFESHQSPIFKEEFISSLFLAYFDNLLKSNDFACFPGNVLSFSNL